MPDWTGPFKMPHVTTDEFKQQKADYVAKHGYRYSIPGFDDIFKLSIENPMTEEEDELWKAGRKDELSPERLEELTYIKAQRREKYLDMLGSPIPEVFQSRAALLLALDDAQDAISTLAIIGSVASRFMPPQIGALVLAGSGWLMIGGQILNFATMVLAPEQIALSKKRIVDTMTAENPVSKKARVKTAYRMKNAKIGVSAVCEGLQVTRDVFGVGISLGSLMALPFNVVFGAVQAAFGQPVQVNYPIPDIPHWMRRAKKLHTANLALLGVYTGMSDDDMTKHLLATNALMQMEQTGQDQINAIDNIKDIANIEVKYPEPTKSYIVEILNETDPNWEDSLVWPSTGTKWATTNILIMSTHKQISAKFGEYCDRQKYSELGFVGAQNASEAGQYALSAVEGIEAVEYGYTAQCKTIHALLDQGYIPPSNITQGQQDCFTGWLEAHESAGSCPTTPEALSYCENNCGWGFVRE